MGGNGGGGGGGGGDGRRIFRKILAPILKLKLALPPPPFRKTPTPPITRIFMGMGVFSSRKNKRRPGAHEIGAAMFGPELRADTRLFPEFAGSERLGLAPRVLHNLWTSAGFLLCRPFCRTLLQNPKGSTELWGGGRARTRLLRTLFFLPDDDDSAKAKRGRREGDGQKKKAETIRDKRHRNLRRFTTLFDML